MYNKKKSIVKSSSLELDSYVEGTDLFNSKFIYMFRKLPSLGTYDVNSRDYRLDLIALDLYNDVKYGEYILLYNGITISDLKPNMELKVFNETQLEDLITKLTVINSPRDYLKTIKY
jgi:hydrogenase maturation factor